MDAEPELHPLARAQIDAHRALAPEIAAEQKAHVVDLLENFEQDIAPLLAPFVAQLVNDPEVPDHVRALLAPLTAPQHFGESIIIGIALGSILSPALGAAFAPEVEGIAQKAWTLNASRPLTPDLLAAAALKGVGLSGNAPPIPGGLAGEALLSGVNAGRFAAMVETAGQSIGLAEALLLERRDQFVGITLEDVLRYSNMNPRFYASAANLKYIPLSVGEVVTANLKGHLGDGAAVTLLQHAGIDGTATTPDGTTYQQLLRKSAGRPPGVQEMLELWNRADAGLSGYTVTQAVVENAVRQSDINDDFLPYVLELRHYLPPPRSIVPMLRSGAISEAQARQLLKAYGVDEPWQSAFIVEGQHPSGSAVKGLTQGQVVQSYENQLLDRPTATARLEALKYSAADATALLDLADEKRKTALTNATVRMVGARYVAHKLAKVDAQHLLATAGVPNAAQLTLFTLWDIERQANLHLPSPAGIVGAGRRGLLTPAEVKLRLNDLGIADADLGIFVADGYPPTHGLEAQAAAHAVVSGLAAWPGAAGGPVPPPRNLTVTQISRAFTAGAIGDREATADLTALGYSAAQAAELIATFTPHVPPIP